MYQYNHKLQTMSLPFPSNGIDLEKGQLPSLNQVALYSSSPATELFSGQRNEVWSSSILQELSNAYCI